MHRIVRRLIDALTHINELLHP